MKDGEVKEPHESQPMLVLITKFYMGLKGWLVGDLRLAYSKTRQEVYSLTDMVFKFPIKMG